MYSIGSRGLLVSSGPYHQIDTYNLYDIQYRYTPQEEEGGEMNQKKGGFLSGWMWPVYMLQLECYYIREFFSPPTKCITISQKEKYFKEDWLFEWRQYIRQNGECQHPLSAVATQVSIEIA